MNSLKHNLQLLKSQPREMTENCNEAHPVFQLIKGKVFYRITREVVLHEVTVFHVTPKATFPHTRSEYTRGYLTRKAVQPKIFVPAFPTLLFKPFLCFAMSGNLCSSLFHSSLQTLPLLRDVRESMVMVCCAGASSDCQMCIVCQIWHISLCTGTTHPSSRATPTRSKAQSMVKPLPSRSR